MEDKLLALQTELKEHFDKAAEERKQLGAEQQETLRKIAALEEKLDATRAELHAPTRGTSAQEEQKSLGTILTESEQYKEWKSHGFIGHRGIRVPIGPSFQRKTTTTGTLGSITTGVISAERLPGVSALAMQALRVRDCLTVRPVTSLNVDWVRQTTRTNTASPQVEASAKTESTYAWEAVLIPVRTIAHWFQVSKQALADVPWLRAEIDSELMYGLKLKEETELLSGDGTGTHIDGLTHRAAAYDTGLNASGDTRLDKIRHAIYQADLALYPTDTIILNPYDVHVIDLIKEEAGGTNKGKYVVGDPQANAGNYRTLWRKNVVESFSIASGHFLAGAFAAGAVLFDREEAVIDISFEAGTNFTTNEATILCEERIGLGIRRDAAFVYGAF